LSFGTCLATGYFRWHIEKFIKQGKLNAEDPIALVLYSVESSVQLVLFAGVRRE